VRSIRRRGSGIPEPYALLDTATRSEHRRGVTDQRWWDGILADGKVIVVLAALAGLCTVTIVGLFVVGSDANQLALLTAALGLIGTVVGAFFGIKVTDDARKETLALLGGRAPGTLRQPGTEEPTVPG
jgi:hypothetical protein